MAEYLSPGVYVEEVSFRAPSIEGVGTSTAGFAGVTLTGPIGTTPELLTSFGDFQNVYGGYDKLSIAADPNDRKNNNYLAMSVKAFFDNGGSRLYVSRVFAAKDAAHNGIATTGAPDNTHVRVSARFPGSQGNQSVSVRLKAAKAQSVTGLPQGSLVAYANAAVLAAPVNPTVLLITLTAPLAGSLPAFVAIGSEILSVSARDTAGTGLTVGRGASGTTPAAHDAGAAVLLSVGVLHDPFSATDPTLTVSGWGATPTGTTLLIDGETVVLTHVDTTGIAGTVLTVTRDTHLAAAHVTGVPVFAPNAFFANSAGGSGLPATALAGVHVLTMQVTANSAAGTPVVFDGLGFDPAHSNYLGTVLAAKPPRHIDALENQIQFIVGHDLLTPVALLENMFPGWAGPNSNSVITYTLTGGDDGAEPGATDYDAALALFQAREDIAIVAAPGSGIFDTAQNVVNSLITHVSHQRAYRVAVLETPPDQIASDNENVRSRIDSSYAALYVPWVLTPNPLARAGSSIAAEIAVPPSGFIAGIYARNDEQHGVAKAPGNEVLLGASRLERDITFAEQGVLNPLGINCVRYFPNRGFRLWGARTASSDPEFKYVNVRRYLVYLEHSIDHSTQWAVFENNGPALWARVKDAVDSFLYNEFKEGSLLGDTPAQAFFVRCDRTTMTQNDLDNGRMICLVGVAVLKPAEFVIFRIGQATAGGKG
jgi:phage tail sheath protein FI